MDPESLGNIRRVDPDPLSAETLSTDWRGVCFGPPAPPALPARMGHPQGGFLGTDGRGGFVWALFGLAKPRGTAPSGVDENRKSLVGDSVADYAIAGKYVGRSYDQCDRVSGLEVARDFAGDSDWSSGRVDEAASHDELVGFVEATVKP